MILTPITLFENHKKKNHIIFFKDAKSKECYGVFLAKKEDKMIPVIIDADDFVLQKNKVYIQPNGYAYMHLTTDHQQTLHSLIFGNMVGQTIDHINWIKTDNRKSNLRHVSMSIQNENRTIRRDKICPFEEIKKLGIDNYPRGIRWDNSENKFVIDYLDGTIISGTKSTKVSLINKFRDILEKYLKIYEIDKGFIELRIQLAQEYNQLIKAAYDHDPTMFPDGPYVDINNLIDKCTYAKQCLAKLPQIKENDVLHGPLTHQQEFFHIPEIKAFGIRKNGNVIIFDDVFEKQIRTLPAIDFSAGSPVCPSIQQLQDLFPQLITNQDVKTKKKYTVKELVWRGLLNNEILHEHTIVPINYRQTDLRAENLVLLPGNPKNFKAVTNYKVPDDIQLDFKYWPSGISLIKESKSQTNPWTLYYKTPSMEKRKSMLCSKNTINECVKKIIKMFTLDNPYFERENAKFQRLSFDYDTHAIFNDS